MIQLKLPPFNLFLMHMLDRYRLQYHAMSPSQSPHPHRPSRSSHAVASAIGVDSDMPKLMCCCVKLFCDGGGSFRGRPTGLLPEDDISDPDGDPQGIPTSVSPVIPAPVPRNDRNGCSFLT